MRSRTTKFKPVRRSLRDLVGAAYVEAVCRARAALTGESARALLALAREPVDFFPPALQARLAALLPRVGTACCRPLGRSAEGATTRKFREASHLETAPLAGLGFYRLGEDGRLFLISKSEHYHTPLGHSFPGYRLVDLARRVGIPNATHNNTRGHITRLLEEELVRTAGGIRRGDLAAMTKVLASQRPTALNRVLNLETGSLAVEAAIKMLLGRFYRLGADSPAPPYQGRKPVLLVMADDNGGPTANYHGTTIITQAMRGLWRDLALGLEKRGLLLIRAVAPNAGAEFEAALRRYDAPPYKVAGFVHELILMNYGGRRLSERYVRRAHALCRRHDVPTVVDEIQTGLWSPRLYAFVEYGLRPTFVAVGKGFPGGEYPASRLLFSAAMDCLPQFGALATNGQEELASLSYLVTMRWAEANAAVTEAVGDYYQERLRDLAGEYTREISGIDGSRHMGAIRFRDIEPAKAFARRLNEAGLDISAQTYKSDCPPTTLTKLPIIAGYEVVDAVIAKMREALKP
jgi:4-aminobutyrate aminotransferase-like enzyme